MLSLAISACGFATSSNESDPPTAIVITSTPESASSGVTQTPSPTAESSPTPSPEPAGNTTATPHATGTDPTATASSDDSETRANIEEIEREVVELRGLELLTDLDEQIIDREELASRVETIVGEEYDPEQARIDALTYWLLRLIPDRSLDLYQLQIDLLSEQVAGYYDPETGELVVVTDDGELSVIDEVTLAHEIVHALQDQHFDLIAIDEGTSDADRATAATALIEGDATLSMTEYMFTYLDAGEIAEMLGDSLLGDQEFGVLDSAPRYIADGLLFSYEAGQTFATAVYEEAGYPGIDAALQDPPQSTEQILHPEKYLDSTRDEPVVVENPDITQELGDDWELISADVLGEWDFQIMLEENGVAGSTSATAAAGWGGSWFDIYESDDAALSLLTTRWDTAQDADEFGDALLSSFGADAEFGQVWMESDRYFGLVESGDTVVVISGTEETSVSAVLALIEQTV